MSSASFQHTLEALYRTESPKVLATLIRLLGDFDLAEEAVHEAFAAAADQWPREGVPVHPSAWLVSTGRFRTISRWRKRGRAVNEAERPTVQPASVDEIEDDELRLIFTCCHPALSPDARIALTLRAVGGLTTEDIARAYLVRPSVIAQRIVRAKAAIRDKAIPYEVPARAELPARLESALHVIYLMFNQAYSVPGHETLSAQSMRLGRMMARLVDDAEAMGLLALMLLHESRRGARLDGDGQLVMLEHQNRAVWHRASIAEAQGLIERALTLKKVGPYLLQAAIAAVHAEALSFAQTDWAQIIGLYDVLGRIEPSPVVSLNRAVALSMLHGAQAGLDALEHLLDDPALAEYHLAHSARAALQAKLGLHAAARRSYLRAIELAHQPDERRFLERRLAEMTT